MKEKLPSNGQKNATEKTRQAETKKTFQEPLLTKHETLVQNTHLGSTGATGAIGGGFGGL